MPYADPDAKRAYQREWWNRRRTEWIAEHGPCIDCGGAVDLEVDHVDASTKVSHRIWSWSKVRREAELAKCVVRCHDCHGRKSTIERDRGFVPTKLTFEQVGEIRRRRAAGETTSALAEEYGVTARHARRVVSGTSRAVA